MRHFRKTDWIGALIDCPHCGRKLRVVDAEGPYVGHNPELGLDRGWILTFEDGEKARMWEDRKGIIE